MQPLVINEKNHSDDLIMRQGPKLDFNNMWAKTSQSKIFAVNKNQDYQEIERPGLKLHPDNLWTKTRSSEIFIPNQKKYQESISLDLAQKSIELPPKPKTRFEEYKELMEKRPTCCACLDTFTPIKHSIKICSNQKCTSLICVTCVKTQYNLPSDYRGSIDRMKVLCNSCNSLINPLESSYSLEPHVSLFVRELFSPIIYRDENNTIIARSTAQMLFLGYKIWRCNSIECYDKKNNGIFQVRRIACAIGFNDNENNDKFCPECVKIQQIQQEKKLSEWGQRGFDTTTNIPLRICPGCKQGCEREPTSCPRMFCRCGVHYCYCCGIQFDSPDDVYAHLNREYKTYFPTNEQILKYLDRKEKIKSWRKNIDSDITDEEIELIMDAQRVELQKQYDELIQNEDMELFNIWRDTLPLEISDHEILAMISLAPNINLASNIKMEWHELENHVSPINENARVRLNELGYGSGTDDEYVDNLIQFEEENINDEDNFIAENINDQ